MMLRNFRYSVVVCNGVGILVYGVLMDSENVLGKKILTGLMHRKHEFYIYKGIAYDEHGGIKKKQKAGRFY